VSNRVKRLIFHKAVATAAYLITVATSARAPRHRWRISDIFWCTQMGDLAVAGAPSHRHKIGCWRV